MPCEQHEKMDDKINNLEKEVTRLNSELKEGWISIRKNENNISELKGKMATHEERSKNIFRLLEGLNESIKGIDNKLDTYINDVKKDLKQVDNELQKTKRKLAANDVKTNQNSLFNWKTISAIGAVSLILLQTLLDYFL